MSTETLAAVQPVWSAPATNGRRRFHRSQARKAAGLTQQEVADRMNINRSYIF